MTITRVHGATEPPAVDPGPAVSIVIPTFNEADNVAELLERLAKEIPVGMAVEVVFVDDSSDSTPDLIAAAAPRCRLPLLVHHRDRPRGGLGGAVVEGMRLARAEWIVVMDGDLQHPPAVIPQLIAAGEAAAADLVVASRYVAGGDRSGLSGQFRVAVSRTSTVVTKATFPRRLRGITDPMSGFFAIRRSALRLDDVRPLGYKILLELAVRCAPNRVVEVPFAFQERFAGASKSNLREGLRFVRHLVGLRLDDTRARMLAVGAVGVSGFAPNLLVLWLLSDGLGVHYLLAAVLASQVAIVWNFVLIDLVVFQHRRSRHWRGRFGRFALLGNADLLLRVPALAVLVSWVGLHYLPATTLTIVAAFVVRFLVTDRLIYVPRPSQQPQAVQA